MWIRRPTPVAVALIVLGALALPLLADAQRGGVPRVGVLLFGNPTTDSNFAAFRAGLRDLGYVEGRNIAFEVRFAEGKPERLPGLAGELVSLEPRLIYVLGATSRRPSRRRPPPSPSSSS
jgi:putative ABC transport system substrate-binding protein